MLHAEVERANFLRNKNSELKAKNEALQEAKGILEDEKRMLMKGKENTDIISSVTILTIKTS